MYKIISFYTPNYKEIAEKYLIPSVNKFKLSNYIIEVPDLGSWKKNTDYKPLFIKDFILKNKTNIIFIDVDATINSYPDLFDNIPLAYDIGIHYLDWKIHYNTINKKELLSGTIFLRYNNNTIRLLNLWIDLTKHCHVEQNALDKTLKQMSDIKIYELPREYCYIETLPSGNKPNNPIDNPIISHHQISRIKKKGINCI